MDSDYKNTKLYSLYNNIGRFSRSGLYCCLYIKASKPNIIHIYYYALFTFVTFISLISCIKKHGYFLSSMQI